MWDKASFFLSTCELLGGRTLRISRDTGCDLLTREGSSSAAGLLTDNCPTVCWFQVSCALWCPWIWRDSDVSDKQIGEMGWRGQRDDAPAQEGRRRFMPSKNQGNWIPLFSKLQEKARRSRWTSGAKTRHWWVGSTARRGTHRRAVTMCADQHESARC